MPVAPHAPAPLDIPGSPGAPASPRVHGGLDPEELAALGLDPGQVLDLSVNVNPYGPAPAVAEAARTADLTRYPDPAARAVRRALAERWRVAPEAVLFAHGAAEILWDLARLLGRRGAAALVVEPGFSELPAALAANGGRALTWRAPVAAAGVDLAAVSAALARTRAAALALAAPTAPIGAPVPAADVAALAARHPDVLVVLDESFLALSDRHADADVALPANVARVRSLTKEHAIPGLRAGYLLADPALVAALEAARPAWPTSAPAQAAALAAVGAEPFVAESRVRLALDREALRQGLAALGIAALPSSAPYLTFDAGVAGGAAELRRLLLRRGVLVRDCASFGLPRLVRVAVRPAPERARLLEALAAIPRGPGLHST